MEVMLDEVPKGDWLCQECKFEERKNQEKDKHGAVDGVGKFQFSGYLGSKNAHLVGKSGGKDADVEGDKTDKDNSIVLISRKRNAEDAEVSSVAKKQALEPIIGSPKTSIPNRVGVLSRNSSIKNLDRGKVKPSHQFPPGAHPGDDTPETASPTGTQQQTARGNTLIFNTTLFAKLHLYDVVYCDVFFDFHGNIKLSSSSDRYFFKVQFIQYHKCKVKS